MEARQEQLDAKFEGEQQERQITWQELAKHNKPDDSWVGLYGSVYDVSKWGRSHPGTSSSRFLRTKYMRDYRNNLRKFLLVAVIV